MKKVIWRDVDTWDDSIAMEIENEVWTLLIEDGKNPKRVSFDIIVRYEERD